MPEHLITCPECTNDARRYFQRYHKVCEICQGKGLVPSHTIISCPLCQVDTTPACPQCSGNGWIFLRNHPAPSSPPGIINHNDTSLISSLTPLGVQIVKGEKGRTFVFPPLMRLKRFIPARRFDPYKTQEIGAPEPPPDMDIPISPISTTRPSRQIPALETTRDREKIIVTAIFLVLIFLCIWLSAH